MFCFLYIIFHAVAIVWKIGEIHAYCKKLLTFSQERNTSQCDMKNVHFVVTVMNIFFPYYTVCNLQNQSVSLRCMLALLSVVSTARNNCLLVAAIVFVHALCIGRSASLKFCIPDILFFICSIFLFPLFFEDMYSCTSKRK